MGIITEIPQWIISLAIVYMYIGIIYRIAKLVKYIHEKESKSRGENSLPKQSLLSKLKNIKWPKIKRPNWMDRNGHPSVSRETLDSDYNLGYTKNPIRECKSCKGQSIFLVDGLCVGCRRE